MKNSQRVLVYLIGFTLGTLLISAIISRRTTKQERVTSPWLTQNSRVNSQVVEPLPLKMPVSIQRGNIIDFGYLPSRSVHLERVWLLQFDKSYPYVRVVEDISSGEFKYMAADQISILLSEGVDVTEIEPMLDELGLRLRMFNREKGIAVIGVLNTQIDGVPSTLQAVQSWSNLFISAQADILHFQNN